MAPPSLVSLAFELKLEIVRQVNDAKDLKNLALVSKEFHGAVAPKQFRRLNIYLVEAEDFETHIASAFTGSNIRHTRHLRIKTKGVVDSSVEKIAALLPPNILHRLDLSFGANISMESFLQICKCQSSLRVLVVPTLSNFSFEFLNDYINQKNDYAGKNLQAIEIRGELPTWRNTYRVAQALIMIAGTELKRLKIMPFRHWRRATDPGVLGSDGEITPVPKLLFQHKINDPAYQPLVLTHLTLDNVPLDRSKVFNNIIHFQSLSELRIRRCPRASRFLYTLVVDAEENPDKSMCLKVFEFAEYSNDETEVIEVFLQSFKGLEQLYLIFRQSLARPDPLCIIQHAATLYLLVVDTDTTAADGDFMHGCYSPEETKKLLDACTKLQQLSIEIPAQSVDDNAVRTYDIFKEYHGYLEYILSLQHLQVLNLKYRSVGPDEPLNRWAWQGIADRAASGIFKQVEFLGMRLIVLAIGSCAQEKFDPSYNGETTERLLYVSATLKDSLGHSRTCANRVSMRSLEDSGVQMDLLKYRSPWW